MAAMMSQSARSRQLPDDVVRGVVTVVVAVVAAFAADVAPAAFVVAFDTVALVAPVALVDDDAAPDAMQPVSASIAATLVPPTQRRDLRAGCGRRRRAVPGFGRGRGLGFGVAGIADSSGSAPVVGGCGLIVRPIPPRFLGNH
jgi:hypothetical protein